MRTCPDPDGGWRSRRSLSPARSLAISVALGAALLAGLVGCQNRKVKVEISATGDNTSRVFATNERDRAALEAVERAYGSKAEADAELGARFTGVFSEDKLPSEIGNRGAIGRIDSTLGSTRFYFEQFADQRDEWAAMKRRVDGGILWMQIFGRFVESRKIKDDAARSEFKRWWNTEAIPLAADAYLMYSGMQAVVQAQRIGAMPRRTGEPGERSADETFRLSVFQPLALLFAERGWLSADELVAVQSASINGNISRRESEWLGQKVFEPAIGRLLVRFDPSRKDMKLADFAPIGLEFLLWVKVSREYRDLVLASPAIGDDVKERVRQGKWDFDLPPPFGFRLLERPKVTDAEVVLDTGAEPFFTNGTWNKATRRVEFKGGFYEGEYRYAPYPAPYYAIWSLPSQRQESVFGAVLLAGEPLAQYCAWENALPDETKPKWLEALGKLSDAKDANPAYEVILGLATDLPAPLPLARWISEKAGKSVPEQLLPKTTQETDDPAPTRAGEPTSG